MFLRTVLSNPFSSVNYESSVFTRLCSLCEPLNTGLLSETLKSVSISLYYQDLTIKSTPESENEEIGGVSKTFVTYGHKFINTNSKVLSKDKRG